MLFTMLLLLNCCVSTTDEATLDAEIVARQEMDLVANLPGQPAGAKFRHYSGYVCVDDNNDKCLFYWFFESMARPSKRPLLLWLNGGPGSSSIGLGEAQEIGPFLVSKHVPRLSYNKFAWNRVVNLLFLESPFGVGFSYPNTTSTLDLNDTAVALNSYTFLVKWFQRFPQFKSSEFYIAGESYAGHYAPQLAEVIFDLNLNGPKEQFINLNGFLIGNPVLDDPSDMAGRIEYAWHHGLVGDDQYHYASNASIDIVKWNRAWFKFWDLRYILDIYSLYTKSCEKGHSINLTAWEATLISDFYRTERLYDPCLFIYADNYFNQPDVQQAMHVDPTKIRQWSHYRESIGDNYVYDVHSVLPTIKKLVEGGVRAWIFSGDTDAAVPLSSTRYSLRKLGLNVSRVWSPWFFGKQVGGFTLEYEGLTFVTIKGAGHKVLTFAPKESLLLLKTFLSNKRMPEEKS